MSALMDRLTQVKLTELVVNPKDDIVDGPFGSRLKASEYVDAGVPIVRLQNIDRNQFIDKNIKFVTKAKAKEIARHHFVSGDILISKLGDPLGEACIAPEQFPYGILVADVVRVRPDKRKVDTSFLAYALNSTSVAQQFKAETKGTTRPRVNLKKIRDLQIPIVESVAQQRQIVAEIEKQFTRLDAGVAALRRVQANLKRYRAAVLKAACEGRLVLTQAELAKAEGRTYETGEQLLARILADRRKNWHGRGKYKEPAAPDTSNLPPLPEGWAWARAEQLCEFITKGTTPASTKMFSGQGDIPFLKVYNLTFTGALNLDYKPVFVSRLTHEGELRRSEVRAGDILINIVGPPLGQVSVVPPAVKQANINQAIARFRAVSPECRAQLALCLMTRDVMAWAVRRAKTTAGQSNLTLELCRELPIPLPPPNEQVRVVAEVERRLSVIEELEATVTANLQRAIRLHQSVLQRAFASGTAA
jgi:type I restriction enzyme S subunit